MRIIRNINHIQSIPDLALTIGNFDGMHLGHLAIVNQIKTIAKEKGLASAILTFEPHPVSFFKGKKDGFRITSLAQKLKLFQENEIDYAIILPFNQKTASISADDFIRDILINRLNTKALVIGYDFIFGQNRQGNFALLKKASTQLGFYLKEIQAIQHQQETSSSSTIRHYITAGKIIQANALLQKEFSISGLVNHGRQLASQLGFPTANIKPKANIIQPKFGVYKTRTFIPHLKQSFPSITNFGIKPTVNNENNALFETHIPNFNQSLYGKKIDVTFLDFIRDETKFASIGALKKQITQDVANLTLTPRR